MLVLIIETSAPFVVPVSTVKPSAVTVPVTSMPVEDVVKTVELLCLSSIVGQH